MQYDKIIVIQTAFIGDVVLATPLLETLAKGLPEAQLTVVTTPQGKEILDGNPAISKIIVYDKKGKDKGLLKFFEMVEKIKRERFDLAVIPHRSLRSSLLAYLAKIPRRVGFNTSDGAFLFTTKIPYHRDKHEVERNLDLARVGLGIKTIERQLKIYLEDKEKVFAQKFLEEHGIKDEFLIGFAPGSVWGTKRWMTSGYAQVGDELSNTGAKVIIFGSNDDVVVAEQIRQTMKTSTRQASVIIAAGKTNLKELSALVARCKLFVSNDTAPMHIARAFNIPTVAIFGPTTLDIGFGPYGENFVVVERAGLECRPCSLHGPRQCPKKYFACMNEISPQEVILACQKLKA
ncbi:MAG: lipopolysaccharide heptosyltransferase II [bacterium]|nr:lipopolysaccharide heptosyltransferase II [bacterium]